MRKIGPALLIVVTAATLTACTAPSDEPAPTPSASSSGPIYPDLDQFTPAPTGAIDAGLQPLLDGKATQDYAYMDPARIVATSVTGPAVITDDTSAYVAFVDVPTNAGTYGVVLSRADAASPWLASRFILPEGVN